MLSDYLLWYGDRAGCPLYPCLVLQVLHTLLQGILLFLALCTAHSESNNVSFSLQLKTMPLEAETSNRFNDYQVCITVQDLSSIYV